MTSATKNSFWYLSFNLSRLLALFVGNIWISRVLGPESFGQFSYLLSIIIYLSAFDSLCHESIVKQYFSKYEDQGIVFGSAATLNLLIAIASVTIILLFGYFTLPQTALLITFYLFIPGQFSKPFNPIANYFDIRLLAKVSSLSLLGGALVSILFRSVAVTKSNDLSFQSFGYSLQTAIYALFLLLLYKKTQARFDWRVSFSLVREMAQKSFPIFLSSALFLSLSQSDIFMINHILGAREVGIYSMVVKFSEPWVIVSSALCTSVFPLIFRQVKNSLKQEKYFIRANQVSIYFVVLLGAFLCLIMGPLVRLLLGSQYQEVSVVFRIYFWSILFLFFANVQHIWEVYHEKYSISLVKTASACALKIGLNFLLGPFYGLSGFALATIISMSYYGLWFNFISPTTKPYLRLQIQSFRLIELAKFFRIVRLKGKRWLNRGS